MLRRLGHILWIKAHLRRAALRRSNHAVPIVERRRFPRVPSRNLIRVFRRDQLQLDHLFNLADFSESGLRIRTDLDAHPGSTIDAVVSFSERSLHIDLKLRVVWVHKSRRGLAWGGQMGVETLHLAPELRTLIKLMVIQKLGRLRAV